MGGRIHGFSKVVEEKLWPEGPQPTERINYAPGRENQKDQRMGGGRLTGR